MYTNYMWKFKGDLTNPIYKCHGCDLISDEVECSGIYYCPNKLCFTSDATQHKRNLKTFKETPENTTVDPIEVISWGQDLINQETNIILKEAMGRSMKKWNKLAMDWVVSSVIDD